MLAEIIVYIALFALIFSLAFGAIFQFYEYLNKLQIDKQKIDKLFFLRAQLDQYFENNLNWENIDEKEIYDNVERIISSQEMHISSVSKELFEASNKTMVMYLDLEINNEFYKFSYVQTKL